MARPRTRPMDAKVMCDLWIDPEFCALTATAQWACIRSVGLLGRGASLGGLQFTSVDFSLDPMAFEAVARELVGLGAWTWVDDDAVEVSQYKDLIILTPHNRPTIPPFLRQAIHQRDGWRCLHCGTTERLELDHIRPWSKGGKTEIGNLQTLCRSCNYEKGAKY